MVLNKTIAIVLNTTWNIFNFRLGLLLALQKEGYNIVAIAPLDEYVIKLTEVGIKHYHVNMNNKGTNPIEDLKLIYDFYKLYKKIKPDVILHYTIKPNIYGSIAARLSGVPAINNISGLGTVFLNNLISSKVAKLLYKISLRSPKKVFFQNNYDRELFINAKLIAEKRTGLLPGSGINTDVFKCDHKKNQNEIIKFLCVARLVGDKGIREYKSAAQILNKKYTNVEFGLLGAYYFGNPTSIAKSEIQQWQEESIINYLGTSDDVRSVMLMQDCIVLPSYREGLSRVLLEAASLEIPIVTTNVPGCKDVVDHGVNGFLCNAKDAKSLANEMEKIVLLEYSERLGMGAAGRLKVINEFDEKLVIDKYREAIANVLV